MPVPPWKITWPFVPSMLTVTKSLTLPGPVGASKKLPTVVPPISRGEVIAKATRLSSVSMAGEKPARRLRRRAAARSRFQRLRRREPEAARANVEIDMVFVSSEKEMLRGLYAWKVG